MTGSVDADGRTRPGRLVWRATPHRYFAIDGGSGAHLLAALAGRDPWLQPVASPRHATLLIVVEPISRALAPAVLELARALPRPARVLVVNGARADYVVQQSLISATELFPAVRRVEPSVELVHAAALDPAGWPLLTISESLIVAPDTVPLPLKRDRELATELAVLSLGPVQPFTAGPLRLVLICDGEQVLSAQVQANYARRGIAEAMHTVDWLMAANLAAQLDPLAPITCRIAYVQAVEQLQGRSPSPSVLRLRVAALALERARNYLCWLVRFTHAIDARRLASNAHSLATRLSDYVSRIAGESAVGIVSGSAASAPAGAALLAPLAEATRALRRQIDRDRLLALRTRGIGVLTRQQLEAAGVSGPTLDASKRGAGDIHARLCERLQVAADDLLGAMDAMTLGNADAALETDWHVPPGEARVSIAGPRGRIGLRLVSEGGDMPALVEWERPSAALLSLVPDLLAGQKLADAEAIVASLDLAMAEADG